MQEKDKSIQEIVWRYDDFPAGEPGNILSTMQLWSLIKPFEERRITYWLGVTPALLDTDHWELLKRLKYAHVGLHGETHGFERWRPNDARGGEFANLSIEALQNIFFIIDRMLRNHLGGGLESVKVFIPPFNVFTQELLDVLSILNFEVITGGPETVRENMHMLDFHDLKLKMSLGEYYGRARDMIAKLKKADYRDPIHPLCLHLTWEQSPEAINRLLDKYLEARK